jgi:CheY-like chemotaxis protein
VAGGVDDDLPKAEALKGNSLVRALVGLVQRYDLTEQLATACDQAARTTTVLAELAHDLAGPLGVVVGMTHVLLSDDNGLNADGRTCLEDVSREALRASEVLKRLSSGEPHTNPLPSSDPSVASLSRATVSGPGAKVVLIADDDPATRRLVSATLASDQYSVLEAADGEEAWRLIREHHPAVAILDWQMPVYTGLELSDVIKCDPQVRGMTVIMLTGRSAPADREAGARARADLYLTKPFSPQELLGAVAQALGVN